MFISSLSRRIVSLFRRIAISEMSSPSNLVPEPDAERPPGLRESGPVPVPVVVVLGATGTGKSKLAVDLAAKFNGEVISADSMQVYKGLDILTNKITEEETNGVPHHMISFIDPITKFDVTNFRDTALPIVENLCQKGKAPVIVGGTNYYIESLLWKILIDKPVHNSPSPQSSGSTKRFKFDDCQSALQPKTKEILNLMSASNGDVEPDLLLPWSNSELHASLEVIDPLRSNKLHPNDRRKVIRSLQIFFQTGRTHTDLIAEQLKCSIPQNVQESTNNVSVSDSETQYVSENDKSRKKSEPPLGGPLRFENIICLWIQVPKDILERRIYQRVDEMIERGLREELHGYMEHIVRDKTMDFTEGILQSIGFKEFDDYLQLSLDKRHTAEGDKLFAEGVSKLKAVTRRYSNKQLKWINQRFLRPSRRQVPPVYWLDGSSKDPVDWDKNVTSIAMKIMDAYLSDRLDHPVLSERLVPAAEKPFEDDLSARICEICDNRVLLGSTQWEVHIKSYKHHKALKRKKKLAQGTCLISTEEQLSNVQSVEVENADVVKTEGGHGH